MLLCSIEVVTWHEDCGTLGRHLLYPLSQALLKFSDFNRGLKFPKRVCFSPSASQHLGLSSWPQYDSIPFLAVRIHKWPVISSLLCSFSKRQVSRLVYLTFLTRTPSIIDQMFPTRKKSCLLFS